MLMSRLLLWVYMNQVRPDLSIQLETYVDDDLG
jgi:hypothetical protein